MEAAIGVHGSDGASVPDLASVLSDCPGPEGRGVYKCHITYDTRGRVRRTSFEPYRPRQVKTLTCMEMPGLDYSCKWEDRTGLLAAGAALGCVTPETFLLPGTKRAFLLSRGDIQECSVKAEDIGKFRFCSLINAMLDPGDVVVRTEDIILC